MTVSKPTLADLRRLQAAAQEATARETAATHTATERSASAPRRSGGHASPGLSRHTDSAPLDDSDRALFRQAVRFVQPLSDHGPRARASSQCDPEAQLQTRREHAQGHPDTALERTTPPQRRTLAQGFDPEAREFLQAGCGPDLLRGLRRGKWVAQATLDLHGSTLDEARDRLDRFLVSCLEHDIRCVHIIHGKGIGSRQGEPVLKSAVRQQLCRLEAIQAWVQCSEPEGGAGAVTALLR